jgi:hypothetical protein
MPPTAIRPTPFHPKIPKKAEVRFQGRAGHPSRVPHDVFSVAGVGLLAAVNSSQPNPVAFGRQRPLQSSRKRLRLQLPAPAFDMREGVKAAGVAALAFSAA